MADNLSLFLKIPLFSNLSATSLDALCSACSIRFFSLNQSNISLFLQPHLSQAIFQEGEEADAFYLIKRGKVLFEKVVPIEKYYKWPSVAFFLHFFSGIPGNDQLKSQKICTLSHFEA